MARNSVESLLRRHDTSVSPSGRARIRGVAGDIFRVGDNRGSRDGEDDGDDKGKHVVFPVVVRGDFSVGTKENIA